MTTLMTGASSGIGEALSIASAKRGDNLFLCARNPERLHRVAEDCRKLGVRVEEKILDIRDEEGVKAWLDEAESILPIERVFANAGVSTGEETEENVRNTFSINVNGTMNIVLCAIGLARRRKRPEDEKACGMQILVTSSIAGYGPLASCPSYSATKSCLKTWALALRGALKKEGIKVSAIAPGFVRSRITDKNTCPMPFFMEADKAAMKILRAADKNVGLIAFPWPMRFASYFASILPWRLNEFITGLLPAKII